MQALHYHKELHPQRRFSWDVSGSMTSPSDFFSHPAASGRIFDRSWAQKKGPVIGQDAPPVGKWNASNYPVLVWGIQI